MIALVLTTSCGGTVEFADGAEPGEAADTGAEPDLAQAPDAGSDAPPGDVTPEPDVPADPHFDQWVETIWPLFQGCAVANCHGNPPAPAAAGFRMNPAPDSPAAHRLNLAQVEARIYHQSPPESVIITLGTNGHGAYTWDAAQACTIIDWIYVGDGVQPPDCER